MYTTYTHTHIKNAQTDNNLCELCALFTHMHRSQVCLWGNHFDMSIRQWNKWNALSNFFIRNVANREKKQRHNNGCNVSAWLVLLSSLVYFGAEWLRLKVTVFNWANQQSRNICMHKSTGWLFVLYFDGPFLFLFTVRLCFRSFSPRLY